MKNSGQIFIHQYAQRCKPAIIWKEISALLSYLCTHVYYCNMPGSIQWVIHCKYVSVSLRCFFISALSRYSLWTHTFLFIHSLRSAPSKNKANVYTCACVWVHEGRYFMTHSLIICGISWLPDKPKWFLLFSYISETENNVWLKGLKYTWLTWNIRSRLWFCRHETRYSCARVHLHSTARKMNFMIDCVSSPPQL